MPEQIRVLVVEDVPQVSQYIRGLLTNQDSIRLLEVVADGTQVPQAVRELQPDLLLVDALLQGDLKGMALVRALKEARAGVPVIVMTVPQHPVQAGSEHGVASVLSMPFSGFDLVNRIQQVAAESALSREARPARVIAVYAAKGGVGRTTIAYNLAAAVSRLGVRTILVDGSLQFADIRTLVGAPADAPSVLNLPTDKLVEGDLEGVVWRDAAGMDVLLAPPRVEMAEMVMPRDLEKVLELLRRVYGVIVIDTATAVNDVTLTFLDAADIVLEILTYDATSIHNCRAMADAFEAIGYPAEKIRYLVNRSDSTGGLDPNAVTGLLGRKPEHAVRSGGAQVIKANNEGRPFVVADPNADVSRDIMRTASELLAVAVSAHPSVARRR